MLRPSSLLLAVTILLSLSACYYPAQVVIHNKSGTDKNIRVLYPSNHTRSLANTDTLSGYDHTLTANAFSSRDYHRYGVNIPIENLDTVNKAFSFLLRDKHQVIVETTWPISTMPWGQSFIINNSDTVTLLRKGKRFKKQGATWIYTVK
jgi:hypothetical protein